MAIPNNLNFTPLDPLSAEELNDMIANDVALADGTAIDAGAIDETNIALEAVSNALLKTGAGEPGGVWNTFSVTWIATGTNPSIGNGTLTGRYKRVGRTIIGNIRGTFGSTTNGGSGTWLFVPPVAPAANNVSHMIIGGGYGENAGIAGYPGICMFFRSAGNPTRDLRFAIQVLSGGAYVELSATTPITFGLDDNFSLTFVYEAAS